jgi:hypothetical protein
MKKTSVPLAFLTLLTLLFSFLPLNTVLAKKGDTSLTLTIKNRTGGPITVLLTDAEGHHFPFTFAPGVTNQDVFEGHFSYYASTPCGNRSGDLNLNVTKELFFSCGDGLEVTLEVRPSATESVQYCYNVWDYPTDDFEDNWMNYGPHCQDEPAQVGDEIQTEYSPGSWATDIYTNSGPDLSECVPDFGPGYYYPYNDCCKWDY